MNYSRFLYKKNYHICHELVGQGDKAQRIFPKGLNLDERILGVAKKFSKAVGFSEGGNACCHPIVIWGFIIPYFPNSLEIVSKKEIKNLVSCKRKILEDS
jgi:hypothetical protein